MRRRPRRRVVEIPIATVNALVRIVVNGRALTSGNAEGFASFNPRQFRADLARPELIRELAKEIVIR